MFARQIIIVTVCIFLIIFFSDLSWSLSVSVLGTGETQSISREYDLITTDVERNKVPFYHHGIFKLMDFGSNRYYALKGNSPFLLLCTETRYCLYTEKIDDQQSRKFAGQFLDVSKEKSGLRFSTRVGACQGIIRDFRDRIEGIKWMDETTLVVKVYIIINCHNKIENTGYEFINDKINLKFQEVGNSMANCVCAHNIIYTFTNLEKKEYKFELIEIK